MLARRTAAEIIPCQENTRPVVAGLIEDKAVLGVAVVGIAPIREQTLPQAGALNGLEVLLGNNLVGIDIHPVERGNNTGQRGKSVHSVFLFYPLLLSPPGRGGA